MSFSVDGSSESLVDSATQWAASQPELANCVITALLWSLGDLLAQLLERASHRKQTHLPLPQSPSSIALSYAPTVWSFNVARTLRLASYAGLLFAPVTKAWFEQLTVIFPGEGLAVAVQRMLLDQGLYASCVICSLFAWIGMWESGGDVRKTLAKVRANWWPTLQANWMLWPAVQIVLQGFIPLEYRMVVGAIVNVPWTAFLAWKSSKSTALAAVELPSRV